MTIHEEELVSSRHFPKSSMTNISWPPEKKLLAMSSGWTLAKSFIEKRRGEKRFSHSTLLLHWEIFLIFKFWPLWKRFFYHLFSIEVMGGGEKYFSSSLSQKDMRSYYFLFRWGNVDRQRWVWESGSMTRVMSLTAFGVFFFSAEGTPQPLSFVFRGNSCTLRRFLKESHVTDATDPPVVGTFFPVFSLKEYEWQK